MLALCRDMGESLPRCSVVDWPTRPVIAGSGHPKHVQPSDVEAGQATLRLIG